LKRWIKRLIGLVLLGALAGGLAYAFWPKPVPVDVALVTRGPLEVCIEEDGMNRISLKPGDIVKPGRLVARVEPADPALLDPRALAQIEARVRASRAALERAGTALAASKVAMELAESEFARAVELKRKKAISSSDYDLRDMQRRTTAEDYRAAQLAQDMARFELELAEAALVRSRPGSSQADDNAQFEVPAPPMTAPGAAFRVLRVFQESEAIVAPGQPLLELGDPADLEVEVDVLSADAVKIQPGARALLEQWGGDQPLVGRVRLVEPAGFTKISALGVEEQRVNVIVEFPDRQAIPPSLGDAFRVEARIVVWEAADVLRVPTSALFRAGRGWAVFCIEAGKARLRPVEVGHKNGLQAEVASGLAESETVIVHPSDRVRDGVPVAPRPAGHGG